MCRWQEEQNDKFPSIFLSFMFFLFFFKSNRSPTSFESQLSSNANVLLTCYSSYDTGVNLVRTHFKTFASKTKCAVCGKDWWKPGWKWPYSRPRDLSDLWVTYRFRRCSNNAPTQPFFFFLRKMRSTRPCHLQYLWRTRRTVTKMSIWDDPPPPQRHPPPLRQPWAWKPMFSGLSFRESKGMTCWAMAKK